uniref:RNA-binding protein 34 n=1 Tax=Elaeophora elaphi TaxID=1147741 RepID=A0A0R3S488_9BILA
MESTTSYFPGAVSTFLLSEENDATVCGKRERKKEKESRNKSTVLFKKCVTKSRRFELPIGKKNLQPKLSEFNGNGNRTSESLSQEPSFCEMKMTKEEIIAEEKARTIFVGNVPLSSTTKEIKKVFSQFGAVESVRLHCFNANNEKITKKRDIPSGVRSLTFYVKFEDAKSVEAAVTFDGGYFIRNGETYGGNLLRVDSCCVKRKYSCRTTVFVGNLPYNVSENELIAHFETAGNVSFVRIVRDSRTGNGKGFAFVAFKESEAVPLALQLDGSIFKKRPLRVKRVLKKNKIRSQIQHSMRTVAKRRICHMQLDRCVKSAPKKARKCGKRIVKSTVMS